MKSGVLLVAGVMSAAIATRAEAQQDAANIGGRLMSDTALLVAIALAQQ